MGLSPRVRGNLSGDGDLIQVDRSIPASAGEPPSFSPSSHFGRVYPRECGGTDTASERASHGNGLSPRVRGNRRDCALAYFSTQVYPRECGGTVCPRRICVAGLGLSPRVRGNHPIVYYLSCESGSIPASAGEPSEQPDAALMWTVYPRECGGTPQWLYTDPPIIGLSPRVRGNRSDRAGGTATTRSIPASAGEPRRGHGRLAYEGVYPRECGGTSSTRKKNSVRWGLSPRVRGNPKLRLQHHNYPRSIPASAGEPGIPYAADRLASVYPRECGGTGQ